jgi:uncharacterized protein (DUF885 family)
MKTRILCLLIILASAISAQSPTDSLNKLSSDFWAWRAKYRPFSTDDVPRMEHAPGTRDWSAAAIESHRKDLTQFEQRLSKLQPDTWPVPQQVDYWLLKSAFARTRWELDVFPRWKLDPMFYVEQTVVPLQEALVVPPPFSNAQSEEIVTRAENIPAILKQARQNLRPVATFSTLTIDSLSDIEKRLPRVDRGVTPLLQTEGQRTRLHAAILASAKALQDYREWLEASLPQMQPQFVVGDKAYRFYLHRVALLPYTPDDLVTMARQDFNRVLTHEVLEKRRNLGRTMLEPASSIEEEIARAKTGEANIRDYLAQHKILTVPADMPHWTFRAAPDYLLAFDGFAEQDDFTSESRPTADGVRWIPEPKEEMSFFDRVDATDPRAVAVHEGIPGHFFQLWLARRNPDPIRRQYYDSVANEGIGFYAEQMMLEAGLFDESPFARETILRMARLRALRLEVDVKLSISQFTVEQAAEYFVHSVPLDEQQAHIDALDYTTTPGLGISYQTGKLQIQRMLADARLQQGDKFNLRDFHDYLWKNGNVPLSLLRWELLGLDDDMKKVKQLQQELDR